MSQYNSSERIVGGDRFIHSRRASNYELAHYKLTQNESFENDSPRTKQRRRVMSKTLHGFDVTAQRMLSYTNMVPSASERIQNHVQWKTPALPKDARYFPQAPEIILDAPDIIDDDCLNIIDWGTNNVVATALGDRVYLWNTGSGSIDELLQLEHNDYVSSVSWTREATCLAVGHSNGTVELWDCERSKKLRIMEGHSARVGSLSWNSFVLSSGCRSGQIIHHDVRQRKHKIATLSGHSQEVCGLKWSTDGKYLASGGNDSVINIWQAVNGRQSNRTPLQSYTDHRAAIKALAWCPWKPHILASGGGTADRHIRFWNCKSGTRVNEIETKSQVSALLWSPIHEELISGHGSAKNEIAIWKYPSYKIMTELKGHTAKVLHLALSPDESTLLSAGADETLRLWKCFERISTERTGAQRVRAKSSLLLQTIR